MPKKIDKKSAAGLPDDLKLKVLETSLGNAGSALGKQPAQMSQTEVLNAIGAVDAVLGAVKMARTKAKGHKSEKTAEKVLAWIANEAAAWKTDLVTREHALSVASVASAYATAVSAAKKEIESLHREAKSLKSAPDAKKIREYLTGVQKAARITSKQYIQSLPPSGSKVKVAEVAIPAELKQVKDKVLELKSMAEDWIKEAASSGPKDEGKGKGKAMVAAKLKPALDKVLAEFGEAIKRLKDAHRLALDSEKGTKTCAEALKASVATARASENAEIVRQIQRLNNHIANLDVAVKARMSVVDVYLKPTCSLSRSEAALRRAPGFDSKRQGGNLDKARQASDLIVKQISLAVEACDRQVQRAIRLVRDSAQHSGYASQIKAR